MGWATDQCSEGRDRLLPGRQRGCRPEPSLDGQLSIERGPDGALYFSDDTAIYRLVQT
jgi:hypothetical protein